LFEKTIVGIIYNFKDLNQTLVVAIISFPNCFYFFLVLIFQIFENMVTCKMNFVMPILSVIICPF
jgi:hypothetical protein